MTFDTPVRAQSLSITFQGGFVGLRCTLFVKRQPASSPEADKDPETWVLSDRLFPEDVNRRQSFSLTNRTADAVEIEPYSLLKLVFEQSSDFFGRIVVYDLSIEGDIVV